MTRFPMEPTGQWEALDRKLGLPNDQRLRDLADHWNSQKHAGQHRQEIVEDHRIVGLLGERAFARMFRIPMDLKDRRRGSRRANFTLGNGWVVDVVTRRPYHGFHQPELAVPLDSRGRVDVWVLVVWLGEEWEPFFTGWITEKQAIVRGRVEKFHERGVPNRVVGTDWLAPMSALLGIHRPSAPGATTIEVPGWWEERSAERDLLDSLRVEAPKVKKDAPQAVEEAQLKLL